ncbi:hypothetical protein RDMS_00145, partial [Deinococcus sp. RL]|uniref:YhgE/Pip family protein n=1 Tax=Deinococcus sp. RL TaxID=1489678 RepID=UPI0004DA96D1
ARGGAEELSAGATRLAQQSRQFAQQVHEQPLFPEPLRQASAGLTQGAGQLQAGAAELATRLGALQSGADAAAQGAGQLQAGAQQLATGANTLARKTGEAAAGAEQAAAGAAHLAAGAGRLHSGAAQLHTGAATLAQRTEEAANGAQKLRAGAQSLQQGVNTLVAGNLKLGSALNSIAGQLPAPQDLRTLRDGARTLAAKTGDLTGGLAQLGDGAERLASGAAELQSGARTLREGLSQLADRVPDQPQTLTGDPEGLAASVVVRETQAAPVQTNGEAFAPYFIALALWVGGTLTTFIFPYLLLPESGRETSQLARVLRKLTVPAPYVVGQALVVVLGVHLLGASFLYPGLVVLTAVLGSLTFLTLIVALNLLLGAAGRLLALVLLVLQLAASGGSYPAELSSPLFQAIHTLIPVTDVVNALRYAMFGAYEGQYGVYMGRMLLAGLLGFGAALLGRRRWRFAPDHQFRSPIFTDVG